MSAGSGFDPAYFSELAALEAGNFWFRSRNKLIIWAMKKYFPEMKNFLEIGCGTGFVLSGIAEAFPNTKLKGSEYFEEGLRFAAKRLPQAEFMQLDAVKIPFENVFDAIGAFDVLEHIEADETVLGQICQALKKDGGLLITVPQHRALWSRFDEFSHHVRRYEASEMRQKLERAGFRVLRISSFVTFLLPALLLSRLNQKTGSDYDGMKELRKGALTNFILERLLDFERQWIRAGVSFPAGGSLLVVAIKK